RAERNETLNDALGSEPLGRVDTEDDGIEDQHTGGDDAGLEAAARPVLAVHLHIEGEQQNERQDQLDDDPRDQIELHRPPSRFAGSLRRRRPSNSIMTPMPAVKTTVVSPSVSKPR